MFTSSINKAPDEQRTGKVSILLADDHPLMRKALRVTLEKEKGFTVVGEANNGEEAIKLAEQLKPDMVIMDISMPGLNGVQATRIIKANYPDIVILILTVHDESEYLVELFEAGASGYLTKEIVEKDLVNAIHRSMSGEKVVPSHMLNDIIKNAASNYRKNVSPDENAVLSTREIEILKMAARGLNNRRIAEELKLSLFTVKTYMVEIFSKLHATSRTEAVIIALNQNLLTLEDTKQINNNDQ
jgi:DNA-binding NarL/FixJ family response regulator